MFFLSAVATSASVLITMLVLGGGCGLSRPALPLPRTPSPSWAVFFIVLGALARMASGFASRFARCPNVDKIWLYVEIICIFVDKFVTLHYMNNIMFH